MTAGDQYRIKAAEMSATAQFESNPITRAELENLALAYLRLADQADRNARMDIVYETPSEQPNVQQQQQLQSKNVPEE